MSHIAGIVEVPEERPGKATGESVAQLQQVPVPWDDYQEQQHQGSAASWRLEDKLYRMEPAKWPKPCGGAQKIMS